MPPSDIRPLGAPVASLCITYSEFVDGPVRPAFDQDLRYDLVNSNRIVFRDPELEISEASNAGAAFTVIRD
jgi:hypothetical protein